MSLSNTQNIDHLVDNLPLMPYKNIRTLKAFKSTVTHKKMLAWIVSNGATADWKNETYTDNNNITHYVFDFTPFDIDYKGPEGVISIWIKKPEGYLWCGLFDRDHQDIQNPLATHYNMTSGGVSLGVKGFKQMK
jgi:hypothetical protein